MMAGRPEIVPRANCVVHTRKNEPVDLVPLRDIRDTPEDRKMYPNDWMSVIYMTQKVYDGLLKRLKPTLWNAVPLLHPNKSLWITLRHLVIGDTIRSSEQGALEGACASILKVFEEELTPVRIVFNCSTAGPSFVPLYSSPFPSASTEFPGHRCGV